MTGQRECVALFQQKRNVAGEGNASINRNQRAECIGGDEAQDFGLVVFGKVFWDVHQNSNIARAMFSTKAVIG
jgi:hypothetical protein